MERLMRSSSDHHLDSLRRTFLGDPSDPNYAYRLNAFTLERMAQMHRAIVVGEILADGILWLARLPQRLLRLMRGTPGVEKMREAGAD